LPDLLRALTTLKDECARLREQAGQTSRISSKPPASAPPRVLYRHTSFGTRGDAGSRAVERLLTVVATCRQQLRSVLAYLTAALEAALQG